MIKFNEKLKTFTLETKKSSYQMKVDELGYLLHTWYGKKIDANDDLSDVILKVDRGFSGNPYETMDRGYSLDVLPQEYSTYGNGDYRVSAIEVIHPDGSNVLDLKYQEHKIYRGKYALDGLPAFFWNEEDGETLVITLKDTLTNIYIELYYGVLEKDDIITRAVRIVNDSKDKVSVNRAMSSCLDFIDGRFDCIHFYGKHAMEREFQRTSLSHGRFCIGSSRGTSSHHHNPFVILARPETTEVSGDCYGMGLVYSGSFEITAEVDQVNQTRVVAGVNGEQFFYVLSSGESVTLPEVVLTYSSHGFEEMTHHYHDAIRNHLLRGEYVHKHRPILINNWEATYFDFTGEKIFDIAKKASSLGIEMLVLDDGWFGQRDDDCGGLGDWYVNEKKLGCTLKDLVDKINGLGMKFGIWFEPEMINEKSNLYQLHPDWMVRVPGRKGTKAREQYVLDYTRKDVVDEIEKMMRSIIDSANIEYIKWDMNRSLAAVYSAQLSPEHMGEFHYRYVLGLYSLLERLTQRYPHILFEGCSGGGGRYDLGMMYFHPQIWCSDDTDAIERLKIQYGSSFLYPIGCAGSHVSAVPNHQTGRKTPFETRATVAMAGSFGYELDLNKVSEKEQEAVKAQVEEYKRVDQLVHEGDYYRLNSPYDHSRCCAWEFMSKDKEEGFLCAVMQQLEANPSPVYIYPRGLEEGARYEINGTIRSASTWMNAGVLLPVVVEEYQSFRWMIRKVK